MDIYLGHNKELLDFGDPGLIFSRKTEHSSQISYLLMFLKIDGRQASREEPDQTLPSAASNPGVNCLGLSV